MTSVGMGSDRRWAAFTCKAKPSAPGLVTPTHADTSTQRMHHTGTNHIMQVELDQTEGQPPPGAQHDEQKAIDDAADAAPTHSRAQNALHCVS